jgi:hypothetical protein
VADIFAEHFESFDSSRHVPEPECRVVRDLVACRTAVLGGHVLECSSCGHHEISYNSCRNRHCPKCQAGARAKWLDARACDLLEVPYFHVVFTQPAELAAIALQNKRVVYGLLMRTAAKSLTRIGRDEKHLGAKLGVLAVLHTWGQTLMHHPHVHCVVPGGGLSPDGRSWVASRPNFLLPVRVLSRLFRRLMLEGLGELAARDGLELHGQLETLRAHRAWQDLMAKLRRKEWVVYSKPPFGGPVQVLKYLARYTHRVAIANSRLRPAPRGKVAFTWKDYAHGNSKKTMELEATEFIRRFLLHVVPPGFQRIRYFGFLSNRVRRPALEKIRQLLGTPPPESSPQDPRPDESAAIDPMARICPSCKLRTLVIVAAPPSAGRVPDEPIRNQGLPP